MSKEYIEKEAAQLYAENIREYLNELYDGGWITITNVDWRVLMSLILAVNDIPPADVKPVVKGEWLLVYTGIDNYGEHSIYRCSNCSIPEGKEYRFCPNCGADMREEVKDEP